MPETLPKEVTQLLQQWSGGDREALDDLIPLVYEELRRMARGHMARERDGHTMQATALVNEVYLKLRNERASAWTAVINGRDRSGMVPRDADCLL